MAIFAQPSELTSQPSHIALPIGNDTATASGLSSLLQDRHVPEILALCNELFGSVATVEPMSDPSEPTESWLCFNVSADGDHAEILRRELEWHEKVERLTEDRTAKYRLSIYPMA